ncbi:MAG TPA: hypothetical protein VJ895_00490 [Candidatus Nanoarchaeia archaeon]|nr:hypothetical protein [Candidatus Nanoarchaeia archaeon]
MNLEFNESLKEYGITKEEFEKSNRIVKSNDIYGKIIDTDNKGQYLMGFVDGGCLITDEKELHLYEVQK